MAKNANFIKILGLVVTVLSTVVRLVKEYTDTENGEIQISSEE